MKSLYTIKQIFFVVLIAAGKLVNADVPEKKIWSKTIQAEKCEIDFQRMEIVKQKGFCKNKGVSLKYSVPERTQLEKKNKKSDLVFTFDIPSNGLYRIQTVAIVDKYGSELMKKARTKFESMFMKILVPGNRISRRVVYVPWVNPRRYVSNIGIFNIAAGKQRIKIDLPRGVRLDELKVFEYVPPKVPEDAAGYKIPFKVPSHPRLLVNPAELSRMRQQLTHPENSSVWKKLCDIALKPYNAKFDISYEVGYIPDCLAAVRKKAFYYLITGDKNVGRDAVNIIKEYISCVDFGNILDITRETGEMIYTASLVYDWCNDLISNAEKSLLRKHMMRLSETMECGWPPFKQTIISGHGNEAQINRDLLSMATAIYDEDPVPMKYCAYQIFERLIPMRKFEYDSPRHSQGLSYAAYRFRWEMYAATIMKRLLGKEVFDKNIKNLGYYWTYMRTPHGVLFRDGDGFSLGKEPFTPLVMMQLSSYARNSFFKHLALKTAQELTPLEHLLFNDVSVLPDNDINKLPRGLDFGSAYSAMSTRTSWNMSKQSDAVAAVIRGGGQHFGGHQHYVAGDFQIFYRGQLISPLSMYNFFGTPYDKGFAKRSVANSAVLVYDPSEKFPSSWGNDGGCRLLGMRPASVKEYTSNDHFKYGKKQACSFVPDDKKPVFSVFSVDLKSAYSNKIKSLLRTFAFIDLGKKDHPAAVVVYDQLTKSKPFDTFWQLTTLTVPEKAGNGLIFTSWRNDGGPRGKMLMRMIKPAPEKRNLEILSGNASRNVFGRQYDVPYIDIPEAKGTRVMFKGTEKTQKHEFLSVMSLYAEESSPCEVKVSESTDFYTIAAADRILVLLKGVKPCSKNITVQLPGAGKEWQIMVYNLQPGNWKLFSNSKEIKTVQVEAEKLTAHCSGNISELRLVLLKK